MYFSETSGILWWGLCFETKHLKTINGDVTHPIISEIAYAPQLGSRLHITYTQLNIIGEYLTHGFP